MTMGTTSRNRSPAIFALRAVRVSVFHSQTKRNSKQQPKGKHCQRKYDASVTGPIEEELAAGVAGEP